jgi:hypothetical protein
MIQHALYEPVALLAVFAGDRDLEKRLHRSLRRHCLRGEWYQPHPHVLRAITDLAEDAKARPSRAGQIFGKTENRIKQPIDKVA